MSIKEDTIPNPLFQFSGPLLVILSVYINVDFGDTRPVSLIGYYLIWYDNRTEYVLTIYMNKPLETREHVLGNSWSIFSMAAPSFSGVIVVLSGYVVNSIFLHHSDNLCQRFTNGFVLCIRPHNHQYKLNIITSMVVSISQYHPLRKAIFSSPEICLCL